MTDKPHSARLVLRDERLCRAKRKSMKASNFGGKLGSGIDSTDSQGPKLVISQKPRMLSASEIASLRQNKAEVMRIIAEVSGISAPKR